MKKIFNYINTMYKPSFTMLCVGLSIIALTMIILAVSMRNEMLAGASDIIYRYPKMLEEILLRAAVFFPAVLIIDLNERRNKVK